jgi:hypothetical protein
LVLGLIVLIIMIVEMMWTAQHPHMHQHERLHDFPRGKRATQSSASPIARCPSARRSARPGSGLRYAAALQEEVL